MCGFRHRKKVSYLKFQQLALFTIYPQMSCLGLNFLMSNIYFTRFLLQYHLGKKKISSIEITLGFLFI